MSITPKAGVLEKQAGSFFTTASWAPRWIEVSADRKLKCGETTFGGARDETHFREETPVPILEHVGVVWADTAHCPQARPDPCIVSLLAGIGGPIEHSAASL